LLLAAALAGCGSAATAENEANVATAAANEAAAPAAGNAAAGETAPGLQAMLSGNGIAAGTPGLHPSQFYQFGRPRAEVLAAVTALRGRPTGSGSNEECGEGPIDFVDFGNLRLNFQQGRFVGWDASPGDPPLRDEWGLRIGSPRADLVEADEPARIENSTLGVEFEMNGMGGLLSSDAPDATVTDLWAGLICAFR